MPIGSAQPDTEDKRASIFILLFSSAAGEERNSAACKVPLLANALPFYHSALPLSDSTCYYTRCAEGYASPATRSSYFGKFLSN